MFGKNYLLGLQVLFIRNAIFQLSLRAAELFHELSWIMSWIDKSGPPEHKFTFYLQ